MWNYIRQSIARKRARRITRKYDTVIDHFEIEGIGRIDFANWTNPLVEKKVISRKPVFQHRNYMNTVGFRDSSYFYKRISVS